MGWGIRVFAQKLCKTVGFRLDVYRLRGEFWNNASEESFFGDNRALSRLLGKNLIQIKPSDLEDNLL